MVLKVGIKIHLMLITIILGEISTLYAIFLNKPALSCPNHIPF